MQFNQPNIVIHLLALFFELPISISYNSGGIRRIILSNGNQKNRIPINLYNISNNITHYPTAGTRTGVSSSPCTDFPGQNTTLHYSKQFTKQQKFTQK